MTVSKKLKLSIAHILSSLGGLRSASVTKTKTCGGSVKQQQKHDLVIHLLQQYPMIKHLPLF